jgi:rhodanese-related sulfurtransferase
MTAEMLNTSDETKAFVADKVVLTIQPVEVNQFLKRDFNSIIVDVRETEDFIKGHIPGAINLPKGHWDKISGWCNEWTMIIYCYSQTCRLAVQAAFEFARQGCYSVIEMEGGFEAWQENKLPVEN